ncbi:MAG: c-type cytochrome domain-containing protein, partial [Phycisphaerae bacterium]
RLMLKIVFVLLFLLTATTLQASAEESSPPVPEASQTSLGAIIRFDDAVLPLLKDRCVHCHGPAVRKSSLDLSRWDHLEQGGENGVVINREDPEASLIWQKVVSDEMPPDRP